MKSSKLTSLEINYLLSFNLLQWFDQISQVQFKCLKYFAYFRLQTEDLYFSLLIDVKSQSEYKSRFSSLKSSEYRKRRLEFSQIYPICFVCWGLAKKKKFWLPNNVLFFTQSKKKFLSFNLCRWGIKSLELWPNYFMAESRPMFFVQGISFFSKRINIESKKKKQKLTLRKFPICHLITNK